LTGNLSDTFAAGSLNDLMQQLMSAPQPYDTTNAASATSLNASLLSPTSLERVMMRCAGESSDSLVPPPFYSDQTKRVPSLSSGMGPGLSARISPVCGSMRRKRLVANDISTSSPVGVSIH